MISIQPFLFSSRLRLFVRGDMFIARACAADGPAQCRQDLPILIPEGWPTIAQRFNVGCAGLDVHKSRQGRLNPCKIGQSSFQDLSCCGRWFNCMSLRDKGLGRFRGYSWESNPSDIGHSCPLRI